jgi:hypothetical protein
MYEIDKNIVEVVMTIEGETDEAYLLSDGDIQKWFPKSQLDWDTLNGSDPKVFQTTTFYMPEWLALRSGVI